MKSLCLVAVLAALGIAQSASADNTPDLKPYSLRVVLPSDSVSCNARGSSLGDVFAHQTGLTVTSATCQGTHSIVEGGVTYTTTTLVINYQAANEAIPTRAIFGGSETLGSPSEYTGLFAKYADCLDARGAQEAAFAASTGLQVFAAYCDLAQDGAGYALVIEAFGSPKAQLYAFTQDSALGANSPQVIEAAKSTIAQSGGTVVLNDESHIFYYAGYPVNVDVSDLGLFSDASQCQAQIATADAIFAQAKAEGISAFCAAATNPADVTLTVVASDTESLVSDYGYPSQNYGSFTECMGDLGRVVQNAQSNNPNVLGGICKPTDESGGALFVVNLYTTLN